MHQVGDVCVGGGGGATYEDCALRQLEHPVIHIHKRIDTYTAYGRAQSSFSSLAAPPTPAPPPPFPDSPPAVEDPYLPVHSGPWHTMAVIVEQHSLILQQCTQTGGAGTKTSKTTQVAQVKMTLSTCAATTHFFTKYQDRNVKRPKEHHHTRVVHELMSAPPPSSINPTLAALLQLHGSAAALPEVCSHPPSCVLHPTSLVYQSHAPTNHIQNVYLSVPCPTPSP